MNSESVGRISTVRKAPTSSLFSKGPSGVLTLSCPCGVSEVTSRTGYSRHTWEFCFRFRHLTCKGDSR